MRLSPALSTTATYAGFLVVGWHLLSTTTIGTATLVAGAQVAGYAVLAALLAGPLAVRRTGWMTPGRLAAAADLASALALAALAFSAAGGYLALPAVALGALRAVSDQSKAALPAPAAAVAPDDSADEQLPARTLLTSALLVLPGIGAGLVVALLGPTGAIWLTAMLYVVCAVLPAATAATAATQPTGPVPANPVSSADRLLGRLAAVLFGTHLLVTAAAVAVLLIWARHVLRDPELLGFTGGAFLAGALGYTLLSLAVSYRGALIVGYLLGGSIVALASGMTAVLMLIVVAAGIAGFATASVTPPLHTLLSQQVPPQLRARVSGIAATIAYLGIPAGVAGGGWIAANTGLIPGLGTAAGLFVVALVLPIFAYRTWRALSGSDIAEPGDLGTGKLPGRLSVTLAYANGRWVVEVRRGRALIGQRHLVKSSEALNMLALLQVPEVHDKVGQALAIDQEEATRQTERVRAELFELEGRLAGLTEMAELKKSTDPAHGGA